MFVGGWKFLYCEGFPAKRGLSCNHGLLLLFFIIVTFIIIVINRFVRIIC